MNPFGKLTRSQRQLANLAKDALDEVWRKYSMLPPHQFQEILLELLPALVDDYGKAAGAAAAQWYEETRALSIRGKFESRVQTANLDAVRGSVRWAGGDLFGDKRDPDLAHQKMSAIVERHVRGAGRDTVLESVKRDPSRPRWARVMQGRETCGWCRMLASRGFVYKTQQTAGANHGWGHDRCDCEAVPDFSFTEKEMSEYTQEVDSLLDQYFDVRSRVTADNPTDNDIAIEWDRSMIKYEQVREQLEKQRQGATLDGTMQQNVWDGYRRSVLDRMEKEFPDGYVGTRRLPPRNPAQAPSSWPDDLPSLRAREWNHILYGDVRGGGHLDGYGWIKGRPEFDADPEWLANAAQTVLRGAGTIPAKGRVFGTVDGVEMGVAVSTSKGRHYVTSIFPKVGGGA